MVLLTVSGYRTEEQLYESVYSIAFRARRLEDDQPVIIKTLKGEYPPPRELARYQKEYDFGRRLEDRPGIIRVLGLEKANNKPVLVVEDFGGESLKSLIAKRRLSLEEVLEIGIGVTACLAEIHEAQIIHKDINPANIIYRQDTRQIKVIDFGLASSVPRETPKFEAPELVEGTLAYSSPEQTGGVNRAMDFRSDYYSLGATLYHLLTGKIPFETDDPRRQILCHLSETAVPPCRQDPGIPEAISAIVVKLMEKAPENRYQSALGIRSDLERCQGELCAVGAISPFALGTRDICERLLIPQTLYGREAESAALLAGFERTEGGGRELMLISGYPGIGKTSLIREVHRPLTERAGYLVSGKFNKLDHGQPFHGLIDAFNQLSQRLLGESAQRLDAWRTRLAQALGQGGQVILDLLPGFEAILGPQPAIPKLPPEERQNRFFRVFEQFVSVFASAEHPLVIFLDDLQWADPATFRLLRQLLSAAGTNGLYVIGAYRANEVDTSHPLILMQKELDPKRCRQTHVSLGPLAPTDVTRLVQDALRCPQADALELAALLCLKSDGNPFLINELLDAWYREGLLRVDLRAGRWEWDLTEIRAHALTDKAAQLLVRKIERLDAASQEALRLASCLGNRFDPSWLGSLTGMPTEEIQRRLEPALAAGLLDPLGLGSSELKFSHDLVQQAAYSLVPPAETAILHRRIGLLLLERHPPARDDSRLFDIAGQLNRAASLIQDRSEREDLAELNLAAGRKAKAKSAYSSGLLFLCAGIDQIGASGWSDRYELTLALHEEAAEAAYLCKELDRMEGWIQAILQNARTVLEKVQAFKIRIQAHAADNKPEECARAGLSILAQLGFSFPLHPSKPRILLGLIRAKMALLGMSEQDLLRLGSLSDPTLAAAIRIMRAMAVPVFMTNPELIVLLQLFQMRLVARHGHTEFSPSIFASYGLMLCGVLCDLEKGYRFGELALTRLRESGERFHTSRVTFMVSTFLRPQKDHLETTLPSLAEGYRLGLEVGDFESAAVNATFYCQHAFFLGKELHAFERELAFYRDAVAALRQHSMLGQLATYHQCVLNLQGRAPDPRHLKGESMDEAELEAQLLSKKDYAGMIVLFFGKLYLGYLFGADEAALDAGEIAERYQDAGRATVGQKRICLFKALARLRVYPHRSRADRSRLLSAVKVDLQKLRKWARHAPENFLHGVCLVEAELSRVLGRKAEAEEKYKRAIQLAQQNGYLNDEALANELAGQFFLARRNIQAGAFHLREAHYAYLRWGATAKLRHLQECHSALTLTVRDH